MPKFVVIELSDETATIELLSYCVKKNLERVSLLNRLEDHPYLRDDQDVVHEEPPQNDNEGLYFQLSEEERQRLMSLISSTPGPQTLTISANGSVQVQEKHMIPQHQIASTSGYSNSAFLYVKNDTTYKEEVPQQPNQFEDTVNSVAHGQTTLSTLEMFGCSDSPTGGDELRRKNPNRKPEDSVKATCKICNHDVMYSPQRTWNLMRHVWIVHPSSKPNQCSLCGYSHIKPYVRKHIDAQHKHEPNVEILDLKSPELEAEWSQLLHDCFGVTYRKWKHHKEDVQHPVFAAGEDDYNHEHHFSPEDDLLTNL